MNIGVDLDQTLIDHLIPVEKQAAKNLGIIKYPEIKDWYFSNYTKEHKTEVMRLFNDSFFMGINGNEPIKFSQEKIYRWSILGHKIVIITARNKTVRKATKYMVDEFFPVVNKLLFVEIEESKKNLMMENKLDIWIDDNPKGVQTSCDLGIETYLIYNDNSKRYISEELIKTLPVKCVESIADIKLKGEF